MTRAEKNHSGITTDRPSSRIVDLTFSFVYKLSTILWFTRVYPVILMTTAYTNVQWSNVAANRKSVICAILHVITCLFIATSAGQYNSASEAMDSEVDPRPESERDQTDQPNTCKTSSGSEQKQLEGKYGLYKYPSCRNGGQCTGIPLTNSFQNQDPTKFI